MSIPADGLAQLASIVCPTSVFRGWSLLFASFTGSQFYMAKLACKQRRSNICLLTSKNVFDSVLVNIQNAEREMFEKFGGGKHISKQGHAVHNISCQADLKEQKHEFYPSVICLVTTFHSMYFKLTQP